ncbi:MFS transporter [Embleya hyalina]|uniref:MFS transporter n=1 Tax=Embleya hyalina TaxID=516124 RepID=A0A401YE00_9ACTN|nr:MFS transporter [Embleya hyalina]GCD92834.1 MFS transporter [Embleya hyalina]
MRTARDTSTPPTPIGERAIRRRERLVLVLACAVSFVVVLDATIVSVALPDIRVDLGYSPAALPWVVNAYTLAFAGFLLLGGRCCDVYGLRRSLSVGMALFTAAGLVCGLATSPAVLSAARAAQGLGAALSMPATLSVLTATFPEGPRRARVLGTWSAVGGIAATAGPVLGGVLTQWLGWRWVFLVNVPLGIGAVAVGLAVLAPHRRGSGGPSRLDVVGALLATSGLVAVVFAVMRSEAVGWADSSVWAVLTVGVLLLGLFPIHQARWAADPLLPPGLFRLRSVRSANVVMFLVALGFVATLIVLSFHMQYVRGYPPLRAGCGFLPIGLGMMVGARTAGPLSLRFGPRRAVSAYCALGAVGLAALAASATAAGHGSYWWAVAVPGVLFGLGTAAAFTPITLAATAGVPPARGGVAAGLLNTVRQVGGAVGLAVLSTIASAVTGPDGDEGRPPTPQALADGYAAALAVAAGCVAAASVVALVAMPRSTRPLADRTRTSGA